jgi:hypothetical protein
VSQLIGKFPKGFVAQKQIEKLKRLRRASAARAALAVKWNTAVKAKARELGMPFPNWRTECPAREAKENAARAKGWLRNRSKRTAASRGVVAVSAQACHGFSTAPYARMRPYQLSAQLAFGLARRATGGVPNPEDLNLGLLVDRQELVILLADHVDDVAAIGAVLEAAVTLDDLLDLCLPRFIATGITLICRLGGFGERLLGQFGRCAAMGRAGHHGDCRNSEGHEDCRTTLHNQSPLLFDR